MNLLQTVYFGPYCKCMEQSNEFYKYYMICLTTPFKYNYVIFMYLCK